MKKKNEEWEKKLADFLGAKSGDIDIPVEYDSLRDFISNLLKKELQKLVIEYNKLIKIMNENQ